MTKYEKFLLLLGPAIMSFFFAMTSPVIHQYFVSLITPRILAFADMLSLGIGAIVNSTVPLENMKKLYRKNFTKIVLIDVILFVAVSYSGLNYPSVRFIGFAILTAITTTLWTTIMRNAINRVVEGDTLTDWQALSKSVEMWASLAGVTIVFILGNLPINLCIFLQCLGNLILGIVDLKAFKMLAKKAFKNDESS